MTPLTAAVLGAVEGVTEFLPVSSTGHLILTSTLLGIPQSDAHITFEIAIQSGAILAVVALYFKSFLNVEVLKRLIVGFIPTAILGFSLYNIAKTYLISNELVVVAALALGGVALILFEFAHREDENGFADIATIPYKHAALVGVFQSIAFIPGVSRSAATIVGGLLVGFKRLTIVEFSFLLAVPTMAAATGYSVLKNAELFSAAQMLTLAIGFITSFAVALGAIKFLLAYARRRSFIAFGVYRIAVAVLFFLFILR